MHLSRRRCIADFHSTRFYYTIVQVAPETKIEAKATRFPLGGGAGEREIEARTTQKESEEQEIDKRASTTIASLGEVKDCENLSNRPNWNGGVGLPEDAGMPQRGRSPTASLSACVAYVLK